MKTNYSGNSEKTTLLAGVREKGERQRHKAEGIRIALLTKTAKLKGSSLKKMCLLLHMSGFEAFKEVMSGRQRKEKTSSI